MNGKPFKEIKFESAQEFWDAIRPEKECVIALTGKPFEVLFRGQADSTWSLTPSVYRNTRARNTLDQIFHEYVNITSFLKYCDIGGIQVPGDSSQLRSSIHDLPDECSIPSNWPNPNLYETIAFAQHYGVPTRLLDWTNRSFVASYFAVAEVVANLAREILSKNQCNLERSFAVWVFEKEQLHLYNKFSEEQKKRIVIVKVPSSVNENIAAQGGCFSLLREKNDANMPFDDKDSLEKLFESYPYDTPLTKLVIPYRECTKVLDLCMRYGVSAVTIYPGPNGAAKTAADLGYKDIVDQYLLDNTVI